MSKFLVTFRIHSDSEYTERYNSFTEQVKKGATLWWGEPTSFYAVEVDETIDAFCSRIYLRSDFSASKDLFLVVDAENLSGRVKGKISDRDLFKILSFVKEL